MSSAGDGRVALSIMVAYWGPVEKLRLLVESVLAQDCEQWILTVVDDCYPGQGAREYLESLQDPRISYVRNTRNLGISGNFRRCAELAPTALVSLPGYDDELGPGYVRAALEGARRWPAADILAPAVTVIDETSGEIRPLADRVKNLLRPRAGTLAHGEGALARIYDGCWPYFPSLVFRRQVLLDHPFRDEFKVIQDVAFYTDALIGGARIAVLEDNCFRYRRHRQSASMSLLENSRRFTLEKEFYAYAGQRCARSRWPRAARRARAHITSRLYALAELPRALASRDGGHARKLLTHALGAATPKTEGGPADGN